ncbi:hypothetical protein NDN11_11845 [Acinetobacter sp. C26M]|uniref:hypothetical protein n=1 Tax=unclassified Acinetobacter TaxID=196816 RepID=UPI0020367843|nr:MULTISPECIES: hypothetical protein [unclassified Acinetobacter]USA45414.1 hypothetical protein NDN11_11845 [Acinetobacter sp. C26M]USA48916.1 hypothetical protein NDN12_11845 [Acinetobacter sp. C26G]
MSLNKANDFFVNKNGFISLFDFIPEEYYVNISDYNRSKILVGDVSNYIQEALNYAYENRKDVLAPFAFYFIGKTINVPAKIRFIGLSQPYLIALDEFNGVDLLSTDHEGQDEYYIENFYLNGIYHKKMNGIHVGGCRNSIFKKIQATACLNAAILVNPTHPNSGDVENIEIDHIWSVRSAGIKFITNSNISRGNITDGTITNCQLTSGDVNDKDGFPIALIASPNRSIFGLKFDRIFTKTTDETHIFVNPNNGTIYGNEFSFFTGESWTLGSGAPSLNFSQSTLYVFDGAFIRNKFSNFYMTGLQGNGVTLGNGSVDNVFDGIIFIEYQPTINNKWVEFRLGANRNYFKNVNVDYGLNVEDSTTSSNFIFGNSGSNAKIQDSGQFNLVEGRKITRFPSVLVKRSYIFENNGIQLVNNPVVGCAFVPYENDLNVTIPSGSSIYYLTVPFKTTVGFKGDRVSALFSYKFISENNGLKMSMHLCGQGKPVLDYEIGKNNVMTFISILDKKNMSFVLTFSGKRNSDVTFTMKDIVIVEGGNIPYFFDFTKLYVEI